MSGLLVRGVPKVAGGFGLIEVLVALAVASLATAAMAATARAVGAARSQSERQIQALWLAERSLEEMLSWDPGRMIPFEADDELGLSWGVARLRRTIAPGARDDLWLLSVTASGSPRGPEVRLATLRRTPWSPG